MGGKVGKHVFGRFRKANTASSEHYRPVLIPGTDPHNKFLSKRKFVEDKSRRAVPSLETIKSFSVGGLRSAARPSATPRTVGPGGTPLSRKIDADELLITWMMGWHGWVDEVMKPGYQPEM